MKQGGRALAVALGAGIASLGLHAGGFIALTPAAPQSLAGGQSQLAMIGNSFEDAVAGSTVAATDAEPVGPVKPALATVAASPPDAADAAVLSKPATTVAPAAPAETLPATRAVPQAAVAATHMAERTTLGAQMPPAPDGAAPSPPADIAAPAAVSSTAPNVRASATETAPAQTIAAREPPAAREPDADTPRPQRRPARPPEHAEPPPRPHREAPTDGPGNARETTRVGQERGAPEGTAPQTRSGARGEAAADGAAAARYPQLVNRHLSRLRRPGTRFEGAAIVSFTVSSGGGLAAISVARSSGNAEFDRLALSHIRNAAPFPPPPSGAERSFNVTVRGR